jgi:hypothetical protein
MKRFAGVAAVAAGVMLVAGCGAAARGNADSGTPGIDPDMAAAAPAVAAASPSGPFGNVTWSEVGPVYPTTAGKLTAFAHNPNNPNVMYAGGSSTGIVGTTDAGKTWTRMDKGIVDSSGYTATGTRDLTVVPSSPSIVLAATAQGIYRSTSAGGSWVLVGPAKVANAFTWVGSKVYAATDAGVLVSSDNGATWSVSLTLPSGASQATAITSVGGLVVAGFNSKVPLELFKNGTWAAATGVPAAGIHQIAVDPFHTNVIYIARGGGSYNYALSASTDSGNTWVDITYTELGAQMIAFSKVHPDRLYYGGDAGPVLYLDNAQTPPAVPATPTWGQGFVANGGNSDKQYIHVEPNGTNTDDQCWVASDQGLYYSNACSTRSNPSGAGLTGGLINFLVTDFAITKSGQGIVAQLQDYGSTATADGGATWKGAGDGEDGAAAVNPGNDNWCYSWTRRSATGCATFTATTTTGMGGQPTYDNGVFAFDPVAPTTMYVAGGGKVYRSTDGGATYADAGWGFTNATTVQLDPNNGQHIAVIAGGILNQSSNGGTSWTKSAQTGLVSASYLAGYPGLVLAATSNTVYKSTDAGATLTATNITSAGGVFQIGCESGPAPLCAIGTNNQLLASADQGSTWYRIDQNTTTHKFTSVHWLNGYLYAGTYGQGIIKTTRALTLGAKPSSPQSVRLANGATGGALTTVATWATPAADTPAVSSYEIRIQSKSPAGKYSAYRYTTVGGSSHGLNIAGTRGYLYRVEVVAKNSKGFGPWSAWSNFAYPR